MRSNAFPPTPRAAQSLAETLASVPVYGSKDKDKEEVVDVDIVWEQGKGPPEQPGAAPAAAAPAS